MSKVGLQPKTLRVIEILLFLHNREATVNEILAYLSELNEELGFEPEKSSLESQLKKVRRDLADMEGFYGVYSTEKTIEGVTISYWGVDATDFDKRLGLDPSLALSLMLAEQQAQLVASHYISNETRALFERARNSLKFTGRHYAEWENTLRVMPASHRLKQPHIDKALYQTLLEAALRKEAVKFDYRRALHLKKREIECLALGIFFRGEQAYLIGRVHSEKDENKTHVRQFPLTRISNVRHMVSSHLKAGDFNLAEYQAEGKLSFLNTVRLPELNYSFTLEAEIHISVVREIEAAHLGEQQSIEPIEGSENSFLLKVDVPNTLGFAQWVLARSPYMRVIAPEPFKNYIRSELEQALGSIQSDRLDVPKLS